MPPKGRQVKRFKVVPGPVRLVAVDGRVIEAVDHVQAQNMTEWLAKEYERGVTDGYQDGYRQRLQEEEDMKEAITINRLGDRHQQYQDGAGR